MLTLKDGEWMAENVPLMRIVERFSTPAYVYSRESLEQSWQAYASALADSPHLVCYAVKANSNLAVLNVLARLGSGFDIVSIGELQRVVMAGGNPSKVVFSGVGKTHAEIAQALEAGIKCFNVESRGELDLINHIAEQVGKQAPISVRMNPNVDPKTHPYIATGLKENKFGIAFEEVEAIYTYATQLANISLTGINFHIGSQITSLEPFRDALNALTKMLNKLQQRGIEIQHINVGGGLGIPYREDETVPSIQSYIEVMSESSQGCELLIEPGRSLVGRAGILLTRVEYIKLGTKNYFAVVDAAMNDFARPALYGSWHSVQKISEDIQTIPVREYDLVGPICESSDFLARGRKLSLQRGDLLAIKDVGAYGFAMSSNYNTRPRVCELMVDKDKVFEIRRRETIDDMVVLETKLPI